MVVQISAEPEQLLIDPAGPLIELRPWRNWNHVITGIDEVLRDSLRGRGHAVERLARIEAVVQIEADRGDVVCKGDQRAVSGAVALGLD